MIPRLSRGRLIACLGCLFGLVVPSLHAQVNVTTQHNDNARTGANTQETILTPANVNSSQFGKLFSVAVDGNVYAQPLYLSGVSINGGTHNVVYVVTEHDSLYALDADNGAILWQISFINPASGVTTVSTTDQNCTDIEAEIGITATPAIDTSTNTIYVLVRTRENGSFFQRLHALDTLTGVEKFGGPVTIQASVRGTGDGSSGGTLQFDPLQHNPRAGLLLENGHVIMSWSGLCDADPYHGWVMSYNAGTLAQEAVFNDTPNGSRGGIWQGGAGMAGDSNGNTYFSAGNGTFNVTDEFGDSLVKLGVPGGGSFPVSDYFTPYNQDALALNDLDLGSGGPLLLPDLPAGSPHQHLLVEAGKEGTIYLIDRDNMGMYCSGCSSDTQVVQEIPGALAGQWGAPAYWNGNLYFGSSNEAQSIPDHVKAFSFNGGGSGLISTSPTSQSPETFSFPAVSPSISANGNSNGIVWMLDNSAYGGGCCQVLYAYDATNLSIELYNTMQNAGRDGLGGGIKFTVPTVANGKVYVGSVGTVTAYGLLGGVGPTAALSPTSLAFGNQNTGSTSALQIVTLSNSGNAALGITSLSIIGTNPGDFAQTNNCGSSLAAGASCSINVTFTPAAVGTRTATLQVSDTAANSPQTASLTGTGTSSTGGGAVSLATKACGAYSDSSVATNTLTSGAFVVPAGGLIVAYCGISLSTSIAPTPAVSDAAGNVFHQIGATVAGSGGDAMAMFYAANASASSSDAVTCQWSSPDYTLAVMTLVYSGADPTAPLDATASGNVQGGTTLQTSVFSTTSANEVIVAGMMSGSGCNPPPTPGSSYTIELNAVPSDCAGPIAAAEDEVVSTQQTNTAASMTVASGTYADMLAATFKAAQ